MRTIASCYAKSVTEGNLQNETKIGSKYQITDQFRGVDQEDFTLIAYAKIKNKIVVTLEGKQNQKPKK